MQDTVTGGEGGVWAWRRTLSKAAIPALLLMAGGGLVAGGVFIGRLPVRSVTPPFDHPAAAASREPSHSDRWSSHPGPWGDLLFVPIQIEPPTPFIPTGWDGTLVTEWFFEGMKEAEVEAVFRQAGVRPDLMAALLDRSRWAPVEGAIRVRPSDEVILQLSPSARARIYEVLAPSARNSGQRLPYTFRPKLVGDRFANSRVRPAVVEQTLRLLYTRGNRTLLSDTYVILNGLSDASERIDYLKAIYRVRTMLAELRVQPGTDTGAIGTYWERGGRAKDVRPLLESLARVPGGGLLDVTHLIPPFARRRLYTFEYPRAGKPAVRMDCHWTTFNFFNETPEDRFSDPVQMAQFVRSEYYTIASDFQLGDVVLFTRPSGDVVHSAVYIADGVLFTRNGSEPLIPWILSTTGDVLETYEAFQPDGVPLSVSYWRKNGF